MEARDQLGSNFVNVSCCNSPSFIESEAENKKHYSTGFPRLLFDDCPQCCHAFVN